MEFHNRLKWLRKNKKSTQVQAAKALHITDRQYQRFEAGDAKPSYENLLALADFFNIPLDFLVGRGVFADWNAVIGKQAEIIQTLEKTSPFFENLKLEDNFPLFISLLPVIFEKIEYDETENSLSLYPSLSLDALKSLKMEDMANQLQ